MTYFKIGSYKHPNNEVLLSLHEVIANFSERGERVSATHRYHLQGTICDPANGLTQSQMLSKAIAIVNAYANDYVDFGLYMDDDTPTSHVVTNSSTISGTHVEYRSWPTNDPAELSTHRSFHVVLRATFDANTSEIVHWREGISIIGTGKPRWEYVPLPTGAAVRQELVDKTTQRIIQTGQVVGWTGYLVGNAPEDPIFPDLEHKELRVKSSHSPQWMGNQWRKYGLSWRFEMESPSGYDVTAIHTKLAGSLYSP